MSWLEGFGCAAAPKVVCGICVVSIFTIATMVSGDAQATTPDGYLIHVGDELELDILDDNDPPQRFTVGRDGEVQLPFIGGLQVASVAVGEARDLIHRTYVEREIFINPSIELSIASFRPISVLGDVRDPGNFDYQPFMTAEQAVGMAGGPSISANNEEARVLERRNLKGMLNSLEYDLALVAAQYARAQALLKGEDSLSWSNLPNDLRPGVNRELFDEHKASEDQVIAIETRNATTQRESLTQALAEADNQIAILRERETVQRQIVDVSKRELDRMFDLAGRGLIPKFDVRRFELSVSRAESDLLDQRERQSEAMMEQATLKGRLSQFDSDLEQRRLTETQRYWNEINKLISNRESIEDRLSLLDQWVAAASGLETEVLLEYQVRRRESDGVQNLRLKPHDELAPGDMLVVVMKPPEMLGESQ
ncbi:polysaccharide biosynthesis/export family protein [Ruegeria arenilitoris]|uniref:polysaccharide biosynthesis/export family protein n=1 Tax=Ruegeria arenilitoris TaxID=1173585 RepID=UPI00147D885F|nr:polysaccharide biosynthesis/export family protein [Ruegeria arenilitoris]